MQRQITGFRQDAAGDWIALLDCLHRQHLRHQPPFVERAWVLSAEGRAEHLGAALDCPLCKRFEWPADLVAYRQTPEFTAETVPAALLKDHATKRGIWARIEVREGRLRYEVPHFDARFDLSPAQPGIVVPEVLHHVAPLELVRFAVIFHRER